MGPLRWLEASAEDRDLQAEQRMGAERRAKRLAAKLRKAGIDADE